MRHVPTGIEAKSAAKSQHHNRKAARALLTERVAAYYSDRQQTARATEANELAGSGMRGDKVKTYRVKDDKVIDHRNNKKLALRSVLKGNL